MFATHRSRLTVLAAKHRLPAMYSGRECVEVGGLMSYGPSNLDLFRRAATYVDKILKGPNPLLGTSGSRSRNRCESGWIR